MPLVVDEKPLDLPVTLCEARQQVRLFDSHEHDELLLRLIYAAYRSVEDDCSMRLCDQQLKLVLDKFPCGDIDLQVYPVRSVLSVEYADSNGAVQTFTGFDAKLAGKYPTISPRDGWPPGKWPITVTFSAGYESPSDIPESIKHAILVRVKEMFDEGGESVRGQSVSPTVLTVEHLIREHRRYHK